MPQHVVKDPELRRTFENLYTMQTGVTQLQCEVWTFYISFVVCLTTEKYSVC